MKEADMEDPLKEDTLKYVVNGNGQKTSVLVPLKIWEDLNKNYEELQKKLAVFSNIQNGLKEVKQARETGANLQTLQDFLK